MGVYQDFITSHLPDNLFSLLYLSSFCYKKKKEDSKTIIDRISGGVNGMAQVIVAWFCTSLVEYYASMPFKTRVWHSSPRKMGKDPLIIFYIFNIPLLSFILVLSPPLKKETWWQPLWSCSFILEWMQSLLVTGKWLWKICAQSIKQGNAYFSA